ncbi:hypothetical protein ACFFLM_05670 [Deinococcus oregonensis]|uniref:Uncharacterized protein n=1 Tax=Deinococcus oregonensis TaxID=1805970 RepID=A0ABV6AVC3_9DEIO
MGAAFGRQSRAVPEVLFAERAEFRDAADQCTLVGQVMDEGVRIGFHTLEPVYAAGVLIPGHHPAYRAAQTLLAALAQEGAGGSAKTVQTTQ